MSNYKFIARNRRTDEEITFDALDDYFGRHQYGYSFGDKILTEEEFHAEYEPVATLTETH